MTVTLNLHMKLEAKETISLGLDNAPDATAKHILPIGNTLELTASTTPAVTQVSSDQQTLSTGTKTIDLTAAPGPTVNSVSAPVDMSGLKVQAFKVTAAATNTAAIKVSAGATNGYNIFGTADGEVDIVAGGAVLCYLPEGLPDVSGSAKTIDITSADADAIFDIELVAG